MKLGGKTVGEVFEKNEGDENAIAGGPGVRLITEDAEFHGKMPGGGVDGGVHARRVSIKGVTLAGLELSKDAVGGGAEGKDALGAIMGKKTRAKDLGQ